MYTVYYTGLGKNPDFKNFGWVIGVKPGFCWFFRVKPTIIYTWDFDGLLRSR